MAWKIDFFQFYLTSSNFVQSILFALYAALASYRSGAPSSWLSCPLQHQSRSHSTPFVFCLCCFQVFWCYQGFRGYQGSSCSSAVVLLLPECLNPYIHLLRPRSSMLLTAVYYPHDSGFRIVIPPLLRIECWWYEIFVKKYILERSGWRGRWLWRFRFFCRVRVFCVGVLNCQVDEYWTLMKILNSSWNGKVRRYVEKIVLGETSTFQAASFWAPYIIKIHPISSENSDKCRKSVKIGLFPL